jgi:hypothetical protein
LSACCSILPRYPRAHDFSIAGIVCETSAESSLFWTQEGRPAGQVTLLLNGLEQMMLTSKPAWNVERTLLVFGTTAHAAALGERATPVQR